MSSTSFSNFSTASSQWPVVAESVLLQIRQVLREHRFFAVDVLAVPQGIVLSGEVHSEYERQLINLSVHSVAPGNNIINMVEVAPPIPHQSESVIARTARWISDRTSRFIHGASLSLRMLTLAALVAPLTFSSCSGSARGEGTAVPVTGTVYFNGQPAAGAVVVLHPQGHQLPEGLAAVANVKQDGSFQFHLFEHAPGVPPGEYVATLQWKQVTQEGVRGRNVLPTSYAKADSSPVRFKVEKAPLQLEPIQIASAKSK